MRQLVFPAYELEETAVSAERLADLQQGVRDMYKQSHPAEVGSLEFTWPFGINRGMSVTRLIPDLTALQLHRQEDGATCLVWKPSATEADYTSGRETWPKPLLRLYRESVLLARLLRTEEPKLTIPQFVLALTTEAYEADAWTPGSSTCISPVCLFDIRPRDLQFNAPVQFPDTILHRIAQMAVWAADSIHPSAQSTKRCRGNGCDVSERYELVWGQSL